MKGWDMFNKISQLKNEKLKKTQVARLLHSDIRTIKKYCLLAPFTGRNIVGSADIKSAFLCYPKLYFSVIF